MEENLAKHIDTMKEVEDVNETEEKNKCRPKRRRLESHVWNSFDILPIDTDNVERCRCQKCGKVYVSNSKYGTGNMLKHLKRCIRRNTQDVGQLFISTRNTDLISLSPPKFDPEIFRELLTTIVIMHELPFQFVEWAGIRAMLKYLREDIHIVSRNTCKSDCQKLYNREKEKVKALITSTSGRINLTSDCWTSLTTDGYICLTAHFIDQDWHLQKKILNFSYMPCPHNGISLAGKILTLLIEWGIDKKVGSITLDNASANNVSVTALRSKLEIRGTLLANGDLFHVRCCAHIVNLIVQDGLEEIDVVVDKVRQSIKYVKGSQARKEKFFESAKNLSIDSKKGLRQDVPTRWNSTFIMLDSAFYYRHAFMDLMSSDENFKGCPSKSDWEKIEKIAKFLQLFYDITCVFSGSKYVTTNLYFPHVFTAYLTLKREVDSPDYYIAKMAKDMLEKFEKYWKDFHLIFSIAICLDPRYKVQFVEFCFKKLYGDVGGHKTVLVKDAMEKLFNEYSISSKEPDDTLGSSIEGNDILESSLFSNSVLTEFESFENMGSLPRKSQLQLYFEEPRVDTKVNLDVLAYWKANECRYPEVALMARDILSIPISTVASESAFSTGGRVLDKFRSSLKPETLEGLICTKDWLYGEQELSKIIMEDLREDIDLLTINDQEGSTSHDSLAH